MKNFKHMLVFSGALCFAMSAFQILISFSPSLSFYFGAPDVLVENSALLLFVSFVVALFLSVFGLYALSAAGFILPLPGLKQVLIVISGVFILRGLLIIPEFLVVTGTVQSSIPIPQRFILFSACSLATGIVFIIGTIGGWNTFSARH
jgi:hypothetical protein